jgi:hypothetical protein
MARTNDHSFSGWMQNTTERVTLLERRWLRAGGLALSSRITAGESITISGVGDSDSPLVIASQYGVFNEGALDVSRNPASFRVGYTLGECGAGTWPTTLGLVEVVKYSNVRAIQRVTEKSGGGERVHHRSAVDGSTWGPWVVDSANWVLQSVAASNGFTIGSQHPSGTSITGTPHVYTRNGICTVRITARAPATSIGGIIVVVSGMPSTLYGDHSLSGIGILASSPGGSQSGGSLFNDRGVYVSGNSITVRCQTGSPFAPNEYFEIVGMYPTAN